MNTQTSWEKIAVFTFGVVFISVLLALVLLFRDLTPEAYTVFRIVIALAAAGIGAVIPGILDVQMKGLLRAGGAMALFVIVYFFSPPPPTPIAEDPRLEVPSGSPETTITEWLDLIDQGQYAKAWTVSSKFSQTSYSQLTFREVFEAQRTPLGTVAKRTLYGLQSLTALPTGRKGNFRLYTYKTAFASGKEFLESVLVTAEGNSWKVQDHNIVPIALK